MIRTDPFRMGFVIARIRENCWFYSRTLEEIETKRLPANRKDVTKEWIVKSSDFVQWRQSLVAAFGPIRPELQKLLPRNPLTVPGTSLVEEHGEMETNEEGSKTDNSGLQIDPKARRKRPDLREKYEGTRSEILGAALAVLAAFPKDCRDGDERVSLAKLINQMNSKASLFWVFDTKEDDGWDLPQNHDTIEKLLREWLAKAR
jgi:hypothetical protein